MTSRLALEIAKLGAELHANRRVQIGLLLIATIFAGYQLAKLSDHVDAQRDQLVAARSELGKARLRSRNVDGKKQLEAKRGQLQRALDSSLWRVPSPAVAQAQMNEWLVSGLSRLSLDRLSVSQTTLVPKKNASVSLDALSGNFSDSAPDAQQGELVEVKASVSFAYDSVLLIDALAFLESGQRHAVVDSLTVSPRERKIDMSVRATAMIDKAAPLQAASAPVALEADEAKPPDRAPEMRPATPASAPKESVSEVLWR